MRCSVSCFTMLERKEVFALILGLVRTNDWDIFQDVASKHPSDLPPHDVAMHMKIGATLRDLIATYDFVESPAFNRVVSGRSQQFVEMKARLEREPVKRREHQDKLLLALEALPLNDAAFDLVAPSRHAQLREIRETLAALSSPAAN